MKPPVDYQNTSMCLCALHIRNIAVHTAALRFGVSANSILGNNRKARITAARHLSIYISHVGCGLPVNIVAGLFGRERTNVGYVCRRIEYERGQLSTDLALTILERAMVSLLENSQLNCEECG